MLRVTFSYGHLATAKTHTDQQREQTQQSVCRRESYDENVLTRNQAKETNMTEPEPRRLRCDYCCLTLRPLAPGEVMIALPDPGMSPDPCIGCPDLYRRFPWLEAEHRQVQQRGTFTTV
jgi:hypothetical protein